MRVLVLCLSLFAVPPAPGRDRLAIELFGGSAVNFRTPLAVTREGRPDIELTARYDTKGFNLPLYYAVRIEMRSKRRALELQFIHHKLYLRNPPPAMRSFEATHGYNILTLGGSLRREHFDFRMGAGLVLAHVETVVRDEATDDWAILGDGYDLTGPVIMVGIGKNFPISRNFFVASDVQLIAARASVALSAGEWGETYAEARVPNIAVHFLIGIGYRPLYTPPGGK